MNRPCVHGYARREATRLPDQAGTLAELPHAGTTYPAGSTVLEAGCGVGAQMVILAERSPEAVQASPRMVYADASRSALVDGFTRRTFTAMVEGVLEPAITAGYGNGNRVCA
jgi:hypothetical protein